VRGRSGGRGRASRAEERLDVVRDGDEAGEVDVGPLPVALEGVDEVLRRDVPGGDLREGAAAEAGEGGLEGDGAGAERGVDVRHAGAVGVVEVAGRLDSRVEREELAVEALDLLGVGVPAVSARAIVRRPAST
jgi:hypothetical protein